MLMRFCVVYGFIYFLEVLIIMKKQNDNLESVFVVRVYDVNDVLLPSVNANIKVSHLRSKCS